MKAILPLSICACLLIQGCGIFRPEPRQGTAQNPGFFEASMRFKPRVRDEAEVKIAESADSVSESLKELAEIERAVHPEVTLPVAPNPARVGMAGTASIDWTGPVEPLVRRLAAASHYRVRILGPRPAIPVLVQVTTQDVPIMDILRDVTYQAQKQADIVLYPSTHVIELRYHG